MSIDNASPRFFKQITFSVVQESNVEAKKVLFKFCLLSRCTFLRNQILKICEGICDSNLMVMKYPLQFTLID